MSRPADSGIRIRRAVPDDAAAIVSVLAIVAAERVYSAIDRAWTVEQEAQLPAVAVRRGKSFTSQSRGDPRLQASQVLDRWSTLESMAHVGHIGTFLLPALRGRGIGHQLWEATASFAREAGYRKLVIQVRATNPRAQAFYRDLGFRECGRLTRQVVIDGAEDDEVLMEVFL